MYPIPYEGKGQGFLTRFDQVRSERALDAVRNRTRLRVAEVQAEGLVSQEKIHEVHHMARAAMTDQALVHGCARALARGDLELLQDCGFFKEIAKMASGEIIVTTAERFSRESGGW